MSSVFPVVYRLEDHLSALQQALGGEVYATVDRLHWEPADHAVWISIPFEFQRPMEPEVWIARMWAEYEAHGARL